MVHTGQDNTIIMEKEISKPVISLIKDGPVKITGYYILSDQDNNELGTGQEVYLCRCGKSKNKPYCDGTHKTAPGKADSKKISCE